MSQRREGGFKTGAARRINVKVGGDIHAALAGLLDMLSDVAHQRAPARLISDFKMEDFDWQSSAFADGDCFINGVDNLAALAADVARLDAALFPRGLCHFGEVLRFGVARKRVNPRFPQA